MNKKDFWILMFCDIILAILLIEHFCGLSLALECLIAWALVNVFLHIYMFRKLKVIHYKFIREDYTR